VETRFFSLRAKRRRRNGLVAVLDAVGLYLTAGYDLGYAWPGAVEAARSSLPVPADRGMAAVLAELAAGYPDLEHRVWFAVLSDLYTSGASLGAAVEAMSATLRKEQALDLEAHCRLLPTKDNVVLLIFFLPPAFLLLFSPLILEILAAFRG
jgi:hypothetical protein